MIQGTTPTITLRIKGIDLTQCHGIVVTLFQCEDNKKELYQNKNDFSVTEHAIEFFLSQEESLGLFVGSVNVQVNGLTQNNTRWGTKPKIIDITEQLHREVIS